MVHLATRFMFRFSYLCLPSFCFHILFLPNSNSVNPPLDRMSFQSASQPPAKVKSLNCRCLEFFRSSRDYLYWSSVVPDHQLSMGLWWGGVEWRKMIGNRSLHPTRTPKPAAQVLNNYNQYNSVLPRYYWRVFQLRFWWFYQCYRHK